MKYISLFSGIGGFELAIQNMLPDAECIGFSEVDKFAIQVYTHHFPTHTNMGDIRTVTEQDIKTLVEKHGGCDLLVGGFPCQNLSRISCCFENTNSDGLEGPKSSLFYNMLEIIDWIHTHNPVNKTLHLIAENNNSMSNSNKELITEHLKTQFQIPIFRTMINGADFGVQTRRRLYWTTFNIDTSRAECSQTWDDVLDPMDYDTLDNVGDKQIINSGNKLFVSPKSKSYRQVEKVNKRLWKFTTKSIAGFESNWERFRCSSTSNPKSATVRKCRNIDTCILDYRYCNNNENEFVIRYMSSVELEKLFFIPVGWTSQLCSKSRCAILLGNTVVTKVIESILLNFILEGYE